MIGVRDERAVADARAEVVPPRAADAYPHGRPKRLGKHSERLLRRGRRAGLLAGLGSGCCRLRHDAGQRVGVQAARRHHRIAGWSGFLTSRGAADMVCHRNPKRKRG